MISAETFTVTAPDGSSARLHHHGGQLVSWQTADGREQLFLSAHAIYREDTAIRGGVPIIFPQFAERGPLPKHGFARTARWQSIATREAGCAHLRLTADGATRAYWPYAFQLDLVVRIGGPTLRLALEVTNTDFTAFEFTAALHTYLRVADVADVRIEGLEARDYLDATRGGTRVSAAHAALAFADEVDRLYPEVTGSLRLHEPTRQCDIRQWGFPDVVIWNPGRDKGAALSDLGAGAFREMVCVEAAAAAHAVRLAPGAHWRGEQRIDVHA